MVLNFGHLDKNTDVLSPQDLNWPVHSIAASLNGAHCSSKYASVQIFHIARVLFWPLWQFLEANMDGDGVTFSNYEGGADSAPGPVAFRGGWNKGYLEKNLNSILK